MLLGSAGGLLLAALHRDRTKGLHQVFAVLTLVLGFAANLLVSWPLSGFEYLALAVAALLVVGLVVAVIVSLFSALYFLYRDRGHGERMVKALAIRVALSATLVLFLVVSYKMGWIAPTGLR